MSEKLCLHHELLLLLLNDKKGTIEGAFFLYGLAGAMLSELLLQEKIVASEDKEQTVSVLDNKSTGDPILDELLNSIVEEAKPRSMRDWVFRAAKIPKLQHRVAQQLVDRGILRYDEKKVLFLFTKKVYPEFDGSYEDRIRSRMGEAMFKSTADFDNRTNVLVVFAEKCKVLKGNFAAVELEQHRKRIKEIADGKLLSSSATKSAISAANTAIMVAVMTPLIVTAAINN